LSAFDDWARAGLELNGMGLEEGELDILRVVHEAYRPALAALDAADLSTWLPEPALDPSRPPADAA
jgi:hypothetical protein